MFVLSTLLTLLNLLTFARDFEIEYVDIVYLEDKPIIAASLNGKVAYFLVDTGSDISIIDENVAEEYGFRTIVNNDLNYQIEGLQGNKKALKWAKGCELIMGKGEIKARFFTLDIQHLSNSLRKKTHIKIQGIIGSDIMKKYNFRIDYKNLKIGYLNKHVIAHDSNTNSSLAYYTLIRKGWQEVSSNHIY